MRHEKQQLKVMTLYRIAYCVVHINNRGDTAWKNRDWVMQQHWDGRDILTEQQYPWWMDLQGGCISVVHNVLVCEVFLHVCVEREIERKNCGNKETQAEKMCSYCICQWEAWWGLSEGFDNTEKFVLGNISASVALPGQLLFLLCRLYDCNLIGPQGLTPVEQRIKLIQRWLISSVQDKY